MVMVSIKKFNPVPENASRCEALKHSLKNAGWSLQRIITRVFVDKDLNETFRRVCQITLNDRSVKTLVKDWVLRLFVGREAVFNFNEFEKWRTEVREQSYGVYIDPPYILLNQKHVGEYYRLKLEYWTLRERGASIPTEQKPVNDQVQRP